MGCRAPTLPFLLLCVAPAAVGGQEVAGPAPECEHGLVSRIFVDNHSIFDTTDPDLDDRFEWAYRTANALHIQTRERVIRRELLLAEGSCFDPRLAEESERLLRGFDFLASVDIFAVPQPDGTQHVVVDTQDEWSTRVDVGARLRNGRLRLEGFRLEERNLLGTGQRLGFFYRDQEFVNEKGVSYATPQLAGTRWDLRAELGRTRAGTTVAYVLAFPFVGEVGRWASAQGFSRRDEYFRLVVDDTTSVQVPVREQALDVAVVKRLGPAGNLTLLGAGLSYEELSFPGGSAGLLLSRSGAPRDSALEDPELVAEVARHMGEVHSIRLALLLGQRNIWWIRRRGLDALRGLQDIRLGAEAQLAVGRALTALEQDDDVLATFNLYTGFSFPAGLSAFRARIDARRNLDAPATGSEWDDVLVEGELLTYTQLGATAPHTLVLRAGGAGGWHTRTPFQLTLGGESGVRGYSRNRFPGGRRLVLTAEDRIFYGWPFPDVLDLGGTLFVDAGRVWPGDVPFGADSGWRYSAGFGLRAAFPAGGRSTYRLDFAFPLEGGDFQVLFSVREVLGITTPFGDPQLDRSRLSRLSGELFDAPR